MAVGTTTLLLGLAGVGGGLLASKMAQKQQPQSSSPMPLPKSPDPADSMAKAQDVIRKKKASMSQSIYTSPLGVAGEAQVARKTLLGQ